jgi:prevent-host-death family protein
MDQESRLTELVKLTMLQTGAEFMEKMPLTSAKARFSELVERLILNKEHIVITKHGKPVAAIIPFQEWERQQAGEAGGLADAAGPDRNLDDEIDQMTREIYEARTKSRARRVRI